MTWYDRINGQPQAQTPGHSGMQFVTPMQRMAAIQQAMRNPAAFVLQNLSGIPAEIASDPNRILAYMKQNLGLTDADIQAAAAQIPKGW